MKRKSQNQIGKKACEVVEGIISKFKEPLYASYVNPPHTNHDKIMAHEDVQKLLTHEIRVIAFRSAKDMDFALYIPEVNKAYPNYRTFETSDEFQQGSEYYRQGIKRLFRAMEYFKQSLMRYNERYSRDDYENIICNGNTDVFYKVHNKINSARDSSTRTIVDMVHQEWYKLCTFGKQCIFTGKELSGRCSLVIPALYYTEGKALCGNCGKEVDVKEGLTCGACFAKIHKMYDYNKKATDVDHLTPFQRNKRDNELLYFGVELEIDRRGSHENFVKGIFKDAPQDFFFFKRDGSLGSDGLETVTVPASFDKHKVAWRKFFMNNKSKELFTAPVTNYGLHIHISRTGFTSPKHMLNFAEFFSTECNFDYISEQSGRNIRNHSYCAGRVRTRQQLIQSAMMEDSRNYALNLKNKLTIEIRCCAATDNYDVFMKRLEFVHNVFKYTRNADPKKLTAEHLKEWLAKQEKTK